MNLITAALTQQDDSRATARVNSLESVFANGTRTRRSVD